MTDWYLLLAPIAVLAVLLLFRFVGCGASITNAPDPYFLTVLADAPVAFFRLQELPITTVAKNAVGTPDGTIGFAPFDAGDPNWRSTAGTAPGYVLGASDPLLEQTDTDSCAIRFNGGYVSVPTNVAPLENLPEFTVEMLLLPEWDVAFALGNYFCALESAEFIPIPNQPPPQQKNAGFGIYAGPDDPNNPASPYMWQFWMGAGQGGFQRLSPKPYVDSPGNPATNPGPIVQPEPTYLAVTFSQTQGQAFLYVYTPNQDIDYTTYELTPVADLEASKLLTIGLTFQGPLFAPFSGPTLLYPFQGLIGDVAIYDRVLDESTLRNHVINAFFNI
jgi:hypothetical protein